MPTMIKREKRRTSAAYEAGSAVWFHCCNDHERLSSEEIQYRAWKNWASRHPLATGSFVSVTGERIRSISEMMADARARLATEEGLA